MIVTAHQDILASWLCSRIGLIPTPDIKCIGRVSSDGKTLLGVVGFDAYNKASICMHVAGEPGWVNREMLWATFHYPFERLGCKIVIGIVPSGNRDAVRFNEHLGFKLDTELKDAHPDGSLLVMSMRREDCRWIKESFRRRQSALVGEAHG